MVLLLAVVLPSQKMEFHTVIAVLGYRIAHNRAASQSHRRQSLRVLAKLPDPAETPGGVVVLNTQFLRVVKEANADGLSPGC